MGKRFCYTKYPDWLWGTLVESALSQGHVSGYLVPSSAMVKNTWAVPPLPILARDIPRVNVPFLFVISIEA